MSKSIPSELTTSPRYPRQTVASHPALHRPTVAYRSTGTPIYYVGRVLCLTPFGPAFSQSPLAYVYCLAFVVFIVVTTLLSVLTIFLIVKAGLVPVAIFLSGCAVSIVFGVSTILSVLWSTFRARHDLKAIDTLLHTVDTNLASIGADRPVATSRSTLILTVSSAAVISLNTHDVVSVAGQMRESFCYRYLPYLVMVHTVVHFVTLVDALGQRYRQINTWLELGDGSRKMNRAEDHKGESLHVKPKRTPTPNTPASQLRRLRISHHLLHEASLAVNAQFGLRMLGVVLYVLVAIVGYTSFFLFTFAAPAADRHQGSGGVRFDSTPANLAVASLGWLGVHLVALVAIARTAHTAMDEARKTSWLVQRRAVDTAVCAAYREELQRFSAQMLTSETVFSVCGVFRLDMTLLLSVAATITSYTIILLTS